MIEQTQQDQLHAQLVSEKEQLEIQLNSIGKQVAPGDWAAMPEAPDESEEDYNFAADRISDFETNNAILSEIESRHKDVIDALQKIETGTYGICEVSGHEIEFDRLVVNPAARTCTEHMQ